MKAQSNIRKFFKKVASILPTPKSVVPPSNGINKPEPQMKAERKEVFSVEHIQSRPPRFESQQLALLKRKRKVRNRMQKRSRRINFATA